MQTVILIRDVTLPPEACESFQVEDIRAFCKEQFPEWPVTARIYHEHVSQATDVTPVDEASEERLAELKGPFYIVVYPGTGIEWVIIAIVAVLAIAAAIYLLTPSPVNKTSQSESSSPNNSLSGRQNKARPGSRIPDIYGEVRSTPDLLTLPYKIFVDNVEVELSYMCVGRGYYRIEDVKDGDTLVSEISGTSVEVYDPFTSPNSGSPSLQIGNIITESLLNIVEVSGVNGQTLTPPNLGSFTWTTTAVVASVGPYALSKADGGNLKDWRNLFAVGNHIQITNFLTLDGIYEVGPTVSKNTMRLVNPQDVNPNWASETGFNSDSAFTITNLDETGNEWVGPFTIDMPEMTIIIANFVALAGLYTVLNSNGVQDSLDISVEIEATPINEDGSPRGAVELFSTTLSGSAIATDQVGLTLYCTVASPGRYSVRAHRTTNHDYAFAGNIVEEVKIRNLYGASPISDLDFGNVTTVYAKSLGTTAALSVKSRKLNMLACRKLQLKTSAIGVLPVTFDSAWTATQSVDEIIAALCRDPYIGNRTDAEIDFDQIYTTIANVKAYFGTDEAGTFNHTFDTSNLSFEEILASVADAAFCTAFRRGNVIQLSFEKATTDSTLLFNHRNKVPRSESRTTTFGNQGNYDGVWFNYVDASDGSQTTLYIPGDQSSINPRKVDSIGITSDLQAYFKAWRLWQKIQFQNVGIKYDATQEGDICVTTERILVADNTRDDTQDGDIIAQVGLVITLSVDVDLSGDTWTIFIQHYDGTTQGIAVTAVPGEPDQLTLAIPPLLPLALADTNYTRPKFVLVGSTASREIACLLTEKDPKGDFTVGMTATNYDARFYAKDLDHILLLI